MKIAIVIGVSIYQSDRYDNILACDNDAKAFKDIIENVKSMDNILFIHGEVKAKNAKNEIANFIRLNKEKETKIDELTFYFSGHGERNSEDFLYLFSDYDSLKPETTSLRNSELDDFIRALNPSLCIKIVDACYSGTKYIKGDTKHQDILEKSAQKSSINKSYFLFSSNDNQASYAGNEYSRFTESFLTALTENTGNIRYRDITAYIADDMSSYSDSKPFFVSQADGTEIFGEISHATHEIIFKKFGIPFESNNSHSLPLSIETQNTNYNENLLEILKEKTQELYFTEDELSDFLSVLKIELCKNDGYGLIENVFNIENTNDDAYPSHLYKKTIGQWLHKNDSNQELFAYPDYEDEFYEVEEYIEKPQKPTYRNNMIDYFTNSIASTFLEKNNKDYSLEKIQKKRRVVNGFYYNQGLVKKCGVYFIKFTPSFDVLKPLVLVIVPLYSSTKLMIQYSYSWLAPKSWATFSLPNFTKWNVVDVKVKNDTFTSKTASMIKQDIRDAIELELKPLIKN